MTIFTTETDYNVKFARKFKLINEKNNTLLTLLTRGSLHKQYSFPLRISCVNVTKVVQCDTVEVWKVSHS